MNMHYYEDFKDMLRCLNEKLVAADAHIEIKAIGGFAMMCNAMMLNFDSRNASVDIDSYHAYTEKIKLLIREVATEFEVNHDWLNTDWRDDYTSKYHSEDGIIIGLADWKWIPLKDIALSNINISYASIEGLFAMKLRAVDEKLAKHEEPRLNDVTDLTAILTFFKIGNLDDLPNASIEHLLNHFLNAKNYLANILNK